jgi:hypothetical protein
MSFLDVFGLSAFGTGTEQQNEHVSVLSEVHTIAGAVVDSQLAHATADALPVTKQSSAEPIKPAQDSRASLSVREAVQPFA